MSPEHGIASWAVEAFRATRDSLTVRDRGAWSVLADPTHLYASDCDDPEAVSRAAQRLRDVAKALTDAADYLDAAASPDAIRERAAEETSPRPGGSRRLMDSGRLLHIEDELEALHQPPPAGRWSREL